MPLTATAEAAGSGPSLALLRLCQLVSPALPVGAFNFSQGLEYAVEHGWVSGESGARDWIGGLAAQSVGRLDLPILLRMHAAWSRDDAADVRRWSQLLIAARDTAELRAEDRHMGLALAKLLADLGIDEARCWIGSDTTSYAALFALAAQRWQIPPTQAAWGYLWAWIENQVLAAIKLVPLGQTAGQRLINQLLPRIPDIVATAGQLADDDIGIATPMHGIASAGHETQYTRLFRS